MNGNNAVWVARTLRCRWLHRVRQNVRVVSVVLRSVASFLVAAGRASVALATGRR